jgi:hypothetical protein
MIFLLMSLGLSSMAVAASWIETWATEMPGKPVAAFFSASAGKVFVAVDKENAKSALYRLTTSGRLETDAFAEEKGPAGPVRAYGSRVYWVVGDKVFSYLESGKGRRLEAKTGEGIVDLALDAQGRLFLAGVAGVRVHEGAGLQAGPQPSPQGSTPPITDPSTGLFFAGELFALVDGRIHSSAGKGEKICSRECRGLERAPDGAWMTTEGAAVKKGREVLLQSTSVPGRFAYVYQRETRNDLIVLPLPEESRLRAYRAAEQGRR